MGTWGTGIFEDDGACDFVEDIMEDSNIYENLKAALDKGKNFEYLESPDGTEITVAAALIDSLINNTKLEYGDGELDNWVQANKNLNVDSLKGDAILSLNSVLAENSELNELWMENEEDYPTWRKNIEELIERLK